MKLLIVTKLQLNKGIIGFKNRKEIDLLKDIIKEVCNCFDIEPYKIYQRNRKREVADARSIYFAFAYDYTEKSLAEIGKEVFMNHATVYYGKQKTEFVLKEEYEYFKQYLSNKGYIFTPKKRNYNKFLKHKMQ